MCFVFSSSKNSFFHDFITIFESLFPRFKTRLSLNLITKFDILVI